MLKFLDQPGGRIRAPQTKRYVTPPLLKARSIFDETTGEAISRQCLR
jgi:hypothetical protein